MVVDLDVPGEVLPDSTTAVHDSLLIKTNALQDALIQQYIKNHTTNPGHYNLYTRQCTDFVAGALRAGSVPLPSGHYIQPNAFFFALVGLTALNDESGP